MFPESIFIFALIAISFEISEAGNLGIIGGKDADIKDFPYEASFMVDNQHLCGATLIGDKWALTTAKCTYSLETLVNATIRVGSSKLYEGGQVVHVAQITGHPKYQPYIQDYDIVVVKFDTPVNFSATVKPIPLFEADQSPKEGTNATISGWGATNPKNDTLSPNLQSAIVPIANHCKCTLDYADYQLLITSRMICVGSEINKDIGPCVGDAGSPLVVDGKLAGINSYFFSCGKADLPAVYVNIGAVRDFIKKVTGI